MRTSFPTPPNIKEAEALYQRAGLGMLTLEELNDKFYVVTGDQWAFESENRAETEAFFWGVFLATFKGRSMARFEAEFAQPSDLTTSV